MKPEPDDIRRIARAARPSGKDEHDPEIKAARAALNEHPELAAELEAERELDLKITEEFRQCQPPAELEDQLLATLRNARSKAKAADQATHKHKFTRRAWIGAAAASVAVAASGLWWRHRQRFPISQLVDLLADESRNGVTLSLMSMQTQEVVNWLVEQKAPRAAALPAALDALGRKGCHIYDIEGFRVSLECFLLPGMREIHLFTTPSSNLSGAPAAGDEIRFQSEAELTAALWSQGDQTMILLTEASAEEIGGILAS